MALLTVAGFAALRGRLTLPRRGAWHAWLALDAVQAPAVGARVDVRWEGLSQPWRATVVRAGVLAKGGPVEVQLVGGAGGLGRQLDGATYRQATVRAILGQILTAAGESLAGSSPTAPLARLLARWSRGEGTAGAQLDGLTAAASATAATSLHWRVLPDGAVYVGPDGSSALQLSPDATIIVRRPGLGLVELDDPKPWLLSPGARFDGAAVDTLTHHLTSNGLRTVLCLA